MAQQTVSIGSSANDGTGDPLRTAFTKINTNFTELYGDTAEANDILDDTSPQLGGNLDINGFNITSARSNENIRIIPNGSGTVELEGTTNVTGSLTATGNIAIQSNAEISSGTVTHVGSSGQQPLDSFVHATYRSAKYQVSITDATNSRYGLDEIYVTHNGTTAFISTTGVSSTGSSLATYSADISGSNLRILIVPISSDSVTYRFVKTLINV